MKSKNNALQQIELAINLDSNIKLNESLGSVLHGLLMEYCSSEFISICHSNQFNPFSQCLYYDKNNLVYIWRISTYSELSANELTKAINTFPSKIILKQKQANLNILKQTNIFSTNYEELMDNIFTSDKLYKSAKLQFLTTTSFKNNKEYAIFPDISHILTTIISKWNMFTTTEILDDPTLIEELTKYVRIFNYKLHTNRFYLEKTKIPGFKGIIEISLPKNPIMNRIMQLLLHFTKFTGVGIKTSLGMGGINIILEDI